MASQQPVQFDDEHGWRQLESNSINGSAATQRRIFMDAAVSRFAACRQPPWCAA
jgi:hypothetical protein